MIRLQAVFKKYDNGEADVGGRTLVRVGLGLVGKGIEVMVVGKAESVKVMT